MYSSPQLRVPDRYAGLRVSQRPVSVRRLSHLVLTVLLGLLLTGIPTYGQTGAALNFDGSDDYVDLGTGIPNTATFTLEAWVNPGTGYGAFPASSDPVEIISRWGLGGTGNASYRLGINSNGTLVGAVFNQSSGGSTVVTSTSVIAVNTWTHIAFTCSADNILRIYINGVLAGTTTNCYVPQTSNYAVYLGKPIDGYNRYKGSIDEVRIWNRALLACEITNQRNCELPNGQTGLVAYYKFNQAAGTSLPDASGNNNTGTLNSFALTGGTSNWIATGGVTSDNTCPAFTLTANPSLTIANGNSTTLTASGANSYTWSTNATSASINVSPTTTTPYSVTGTTANGCAIASATVNIIQNIPPCTTFLGSGTATGLGSNDVYKVLVIGNTIFAGTGLGLSRSTDGGNTFTNNRIINSSSTGATVYDIVTQNNIIYLATSQGVYKSTDNGQSFTRLLSGLFKALFVDNNTIYAGGYTGDLYKSTNAGQTFSKIRSFTSTMITGVWASGNTVYVTNMLGLSSPTGIHKSIDGGQTFTMQSFSGITNYYSFFITGNTIYVGTNGGLAISTDGGLNYTLRKTTDGLSSNNVKAFFKQDDYIYLATDNGISISEDQGQTFTKYTLENSGINPNVLCIFVKGSTIYTGTVRGVFTSGFIVRTIMPGNLSFLNTVATLAPGTSATLIAPVNNDTYTWSTSSGSSSIVVNTSGTYSVTATGTCSGVGSVSVTVLPVNSGTETAFLTTTQCPVKLTITQNHYQMDVTGPGGYQFTNVLRPTFVPSPGSELYLPATAFITNIRKAGTYTATFYDKSKKVVSVISYAVNGSGCQ
nr:LamG-like jellyroll fold domain-containing protein [uncultured Arsenicibacter sp.]